MSQALGLKDLMEVAGLYGAVRWQESQFAKAVAYPARLIEYVGFKEQERAQHVMLACEAMGLSIKGVMEMDYYEDRARFRTTVMPVDGYTVHGQKYSIVCTLNRVAALVDNSAGVDVHALTRKLALVRNDPP